MSGGAWLAVVGIGEDGLDGLGRAARAAVDAADVLVGGARHLAMVPDDGRERLAWPSPFDALVDAIAARRGHAVCVLASGDPMWFGVGSVLARHFGREDMVVHPAPSSPSLACARLGWALQDVEVVSLHGRPLATLHPAVQPGARLVVVPGGESTPQAIAGLLVGRGFGASRVVVLERLGGPRERIVEARAAELPHAGLDDLCLLAVDCVADDGAVVLPRVPGLPDDAYRHDGQLTKRVVRAATLAALAPAPGLLLWDVGAGCGSIAIEWLRSAPRARAVAIERVATRVAHIRDNARALGTPALAVVEGAAPAALAGLDTPDAVFIGGGVSRAGVFDGCWARLRSGGRLVANAVTLQGAAVLYRRHAEHGGDLARITVEHAERAGSFEAFRPARAITQLSVTKN